MVLNGHDLKVIFYYGFDLSISFCTEPDFPYLEALGPFQPLMMRVSIPIYEELFVYK